jgi:hypothetical protein
LVSLAIYKKNSRKNFRLSTKTIRFRVFNETHSTGYAILKNPYEIISKHCLKMAATPL